jgi:putative membrane protein
LPTSEPANEIRNGDGPAKGASPFTEAEVRNRMQLQGYRQISALTKDKDGVWHASASKNGRQVHVALDSKGNMSTN